MLVKSQNIVPEKFDIGIHPAFVVVICFIFCWSI